ncbi:MAG: hypothetical protein KUG77_23915 [Nannocystaceae bacterium]|nr:hypothetical protein [Nannocystaceae bacterium]
MPHPRLAPAATFVGFALVAAAFQVLATLLLGLAPLEAIQRAADEGSRLYLIGAVGTTVATGVLWGLRKRPLVASIAFLTLELTLLIGLVTRTTRLGLAYHGEFILHHFITALCAAASVSLGWAWCRQDQFGARRWFAGLPAILGGVGLFVIHVLEQPGIGIRIPTAALQTAMGFALTAPAAALAATWGQHDERKPMARILAIAVIVPLLLRVVVGLPASLTGSPIPDGARTAVMASVVAASAVAFWAFRPQMPRPVRFIVIALSAFVTALLYMVYVHPLGFGKLEDGIGGVAQSLFGFSLPYPTFVASWRVVMVCIAVFFILSVVYGGLLSWDERLRGLALGLYAITGIGVSNPQLALMASAALLLVVHTMMRSSSPSGVDASASDVPVEDIFRDTADLLDLPAPITLEDTAVFIRGDLGGAALDLRARPRRGGGWQISFSVGVIGRGRPMLELMPSSRSGGPRPAHELALTHRAVGDVRRLEDVDDAQLDALQPFAAANARYWDAGVEIDLGPDLADLDAPRLAALLRASASDV